MLWYAMLCSPAAPPPPPWRPAPAAAAPKAAELAAAVPGALPAAALHLQRRTCFGEWESGTRNRRQVRRAGGAARRLGPGLLRQHGSTQAAFTLKAAGTATQPHSCTRITALQQHSNKRRATTKPPLTHHLGQIVRHHQASPPSGPPARDAAVPPATPPGACPCQLATAPAPLPPAAGAPPAEPGPGTPLQGGGWGQERAGVRQSREKEQGGQGSGSACMQCSCLSWFRNLLRSNPAALHLACAVAELAAICRGPQLQALEREAAAGVGWCLWPGRKPAWRCRCCQKRRWVARQLMHQVAQRCVAEACTRWKAAVEELRSLLPCALRPAREGSGSRQQLQSVKRQSQQQPTSATARQQGGQARCPSTRPTCVPDVQQAQRRRREHAPLQRQQLGGREEAACGRLRITRLRGPWSRRRGRPPQQGVVCQQQPAQAVGGLQEAPVKKHLLQRVCSEQ